MDDNEHGTHVAGTIAAVGTAKESWGGPQARIIPTRRWTRPGRGRSGIINGSSGRRRTTWTSSTCPWRPTPQQGLQRAVKYAQSKECSSWRRGEFRSRRRDGVLSRGVDGVIAVSSLRQDGSIAKFSSAAPKWSFIAPGWR